VNGIHLEDGKKREPLTARRKRKIYPARKESAPVEDPLFQVFMDTQKGVSSLCRGGEEGEILGQKEKKEELSSGDDERDKQQRKERIA